MYEIPTWYVHNTYYLIWLIAYEFRHTNLRVRLFVQYGVACGLRPLFPAGPLLPDSL